jgi:hypothetical protein
LCVCECAVSCWYKKKIIKNRKIFLKLHRCVNQKKRKISFKRRKYVNYLLNFLSIPKQYKKTPTTTVNNK